MDEKTRKDLDVIKQAQNEITLSEKPVIMKIIEDRREKLNQMTQEYLDEHGKSVLSDIDINYILTKNNSYVRVTYTPEDMAYLFEWYKDVVSRLQHQTAIYYPTRQQFCAMIGIPSSEYEKMLKSDDIRMVEIMMKIEDYIQDITYRMSAGNILNTRMAIHQLEAVHGRTPVKKTETVMIDEKLDLDATRRRMNNIFAVVDADYVEKESKGELEDE